MYAYLQQQASIQMCVFNNCDMKNDHMFSQKPAVFVHDPICGNEKQTIHNKNLMMATCENRGLILLYRDLSV